MNLPISVCFIRVMLFTFLVSGSGVNAFAMEVKATVKAAVV
jgi:hypothetical protein